MVRSNQELLHKQESFHIKQDDKFFSKLLSKETSATIGNPSFRVYYGDVSGAVPFTWETQPGTPKHALSDSGSLPPLTPPPAAAYNNSRVSISSKGLNNSSMDIQPSRGSSNFLIMRTLVMRIVSTLKNNNNNNNKNKNKNMYSRRHHHRHVQLSPSYCSSSLSSSSSSQHSPSNYVSDFHGKRGSWSVCFGLGKSNTVKETMFSIISRGSD